MAPKSWLQIPRDQLHEALKRKIVTSISADLTFGAEDVQAAVAWGDRNAYNYSDLGDLLLQWALSGSPGAGGPDIESCDYRFYGSMG